MTTSIRVLTTSTLDSSPSLLIAGGDGSKILINCGEGCQRSFLESSSSSSLARSTSSGASLSSRPNTGALKVRSVKMVCLTSLGHESLGGLPGFILTSADASEVKMTNAIKQMAAISHGGTKRKLSSLNTRAEDSSTGSLFESDNDRRIGTGTRRNAPLPVLDVIGPVGTKSFLHSLRHFMRRDKFRVIPHECGESAEASSPSESSARGSIADDPAGGAWEAPSRPSRDNRRQTPNGQNIRVQSIPLSYSVPAPASANGTGAIMLPACSYIFTSPPQNKFRPDKAKALGIPPGPLYGQLKSGKEVTYIDSNDSKSNREKTARPEQVLDEGSPGISVAVLYVPTFEVFEALRKTSALGKYCTCSTCPSTTSGTSGNKDGRNEQSSTLEVMVHIIPRQVFESQPYRMWLSEFGDETIDHITLFTMSNFDGGNEELDGTPFRSSAVTGAMARASIDSDVYLPPFPLSDTSKEIPITTPFNGDVADVAGDEVSGRRLNVIVARPLMEYVLIPRKRRGLACGVGGDHERYTQDCIRPCERDEIKTLVTASGAIEAAATALNNYNNVAPQKQNDENKSSGSLIFTGTGSAIPCKHRNVTGKILTMGNGKSIMLDVGEGTTGNLLRCWKYRQQPGVGSRGNFNAPKEDTKERCRRLQQSLIDIKAIWISHSHADHFLGILRLLRERSEAVTQLSSDSAVSPVILMAPKAIFRFLAEYSLVDPRMLGTYIPVDCCDMKQNAVSPIGARLRQELGISCFSVPVTHCLHSFAVVLDGTPFGRVVYSGDCRPSVQLASAGKGADLLIHEATFEDGMEAEAVIKKHSTVGEALFIGKRMDVQGAIVLTHFSQRYPRIPPMPSSSCSGEIPTIFAFDFMKLTPTNIQKASLLTSAVRLLYPEDGADKTEDLDIIMEGSSSRDCQLTANDLLAIPGAFAAASTQKSVSQAPAQRSKP